MAFTQYGSTDYVFGFEDAGAAEIAATCGMKPQTLSVSMEPEYQATALDEHGQVDSKVVGPDKFNFTMSGYITDESAFNAAVGFEYGGNYYIVTGRKVDSSATDFRKCELSGESFQNITGAPA